MPDFRQYHDHVRAIAAAALDAAEPGRVVRTRLRREGRRLVLPDAEFDLESGRIFLIAAGKASERMARAAADILGADLAAGIVVGKRERADLPPPLVYHPADHPLPSARSVAATAQVLALASQAGPDDLVLCLISGGTSALLSQPIIPLAAWRTLNQALIQAGCTINEVNAVRQRFDSVKAGGLARAIAPAACVSLILSDVIGNRLEHIGSGPTVPLVSETSQIRALVRRYEILDKLPLEHRQVIEVALSGHQPRPAAPPPVLRNVIVGDVSLAADAAARAASRLGFAANVASTHLIGEARRLGRVLADKARSAPPGQCLVYGGESTVTVMGAGFGGRNQEMALATAIALHRVPGRVVACFSTDGDDGVPPPGANPVAGAVVDGETFTRGRSVGLDAKACLDINDSYAFFHALPGTHLVLPSGTNVNDLAIILTYDADTLA